MTGAFARGEATVVLQASLDEEVEQAALVAEVLLLGQLKQRDESLRSRRVGLDALDLEGRLGLIPDGIWRSAPRIQPVAFLWPANRARS